MFTYKKKQQHKKTVPMQKQHEHKKQMKNKINNNNQKSLNSMVNQKKYICFGVLLKIRWDKVFK